MSKKFEDSAVEAVLSMARNLPAEEQDRILDWLIALLKIRESDVSAKRKLKLAYQTTKRRKAIWPFVKALNEQIIEHGWNKRGLSARMFIVAASAGFVAFGGAGAGIAAFGGAIGVPLWIVLGGGGAVAGVVVEELQASKK